MPVDGQIRLAVAIPTEWDADMKSPVLRCLQMACLSLSLGSRAAAVETVMLADPEPSLALHIEGSTLSRSGEVAVRGGAESSIRGIGLTRERMLDRSMKPGANGGVITYQIIRDRLTRQEAGDPVVTRQPLDGTTATGRRDGSGRWLFFPAGKRVPGDVEELEFLTAFENRRWLPGRAVAIGETWEFPAEFIRRSLQRDIPQPEVVGMMKLREIGKNPAGQRQAIIDCVIRGGGGKSLPRGGAEAEGKLSGTLIVDLEKPGTMRLQLTGQFTISTQSGAESSRSVLPLTLMVKIEPAAAR